MIFWLARNADDSLYLYKNKPHLALYTGVFCLSEERLWDYDDCGGIKMDKNKYRKVTYLNSPCKVNVELKLIEKCTK